MRTREAALLVAAAVALALAGCDRGATKNVNAPGGPGTGNAREVAAPSAPDTPATGTGLKSPVAGATGSGNASTQSGTGLQGGLGGTGISGTFPSSGASASATQSMGGVADGSKNLTPKGSVGNRP